MKTQKLFVLVIAVAAFLVIGASNATACCTSEFSGWWVLAVESAPEEVILENKECKFAIDELRQQGYQFQAMTNTGNEHTQILYCQQQRVNDGSGLRLGNMVALFCLANIQTKLGDPGGPGF